MALLLDAFGRPRRRRNTVGSHATIEKPRLERTSIETFVDAESFIARVHEIIEHPDDRLDQNQRDDLVLFAKLWVAPPNI